MTPAELWSESFGLLPHRVTAYEHPQKGLTIYLRWRAGGDWKRRSLGVTLRDARGRIRGEIKRMALAEAERQYELNTGRRTAMPAAAAPLTIGATWAAISAKNGLYPILTPHAKEVAHALRAAARIWGEHLGWDQIDRARIRMLARTRVDELRSSDHAGYRGAELTLQRVFAVAAWLRDESLIATDACLPPRRWRDELRSYWTQTAGREPETARPRHTLDEMRALLQVAPRVDPRFALLLALGAELRLGQVARCRRSDLSVEHRTVTIRGVGKKKGIVVQLTRGQWAAWETARDGYLAKLEAEPMDYPLFPEGQLPGGRTGQGGGVATVERHATARPIERTAIRKWFREAEQLAGIAHVTGRGAYGLRRVAVDGAKERKISREGLKALGGWSDTQIPDGIYADQDMAYARDEAARLRAQLRGEPE